MSWSYSGNPGASAKDAVRFLVGDTESVDPLLSDQEIEWSLTQNSSSPQATALFLCDRLIAKFARLADETVGRISISYSQKAEGYRKLKADLQESAVHDAMPYAGGISISDGQMVSGDPDRVRPAFTKHMQENHQVSPAISSEMRPSLQDPGD